ncbi:MAG: hypothetical protein OHK0039_47590 [Bacteroidia bacterium]
MLTQEPAHTASLPGAAETSHLIRSRRSIYPQHYSGAEIPRDQIEMMLENAHWAPTHGRTEPWRFFVYTGAGRAQFGELHASLYKLHTPAEAFSEATYEKLKVRPLECACFIVLCMKRGDNPKIPVVEEVEAVAAAVQNMHLTATALGLGAYWGSGGMTYHPSLRDALGLGPDDQVLGFLHVGVPAADAPAPKALRRSAWQDHVVWAE